jgi:hypothetical protein
MFDQPDKIARSKSKANKFVHDTEPKRKTIQLSKKMNPPQTVTNKNGDLSSSMFESLKYQSIGLKLENKPQRITSQKVSQGEEKYRYNNIRDRFR